MEKHDLVITAGDPAGIGYEIACKFFADEISRNFDVALIGHRFIAEKTFKDILKINIPDNFIIIEPDDSYFEYEYGKHNADCGKASMKYIEYAVKGAIDGHYNAIVTCPINKKSIKDAGYNFPGHTEYLGYLSGRENISMMLAGINIKTILATTHYPISEVAKYVTEDKVYTAIKNAHNAGKFFGKIKPKIAVCGLNPHAGDNGVLGNEEQNIIIPVIEKAKNENIDVYGPFPADTVFINKDWDFIISMYHDQGMIPVKMDSFGEAVNVTLNLPFIRTSVDHGTAFDIAGTGKASYSSLIKAVELANKMVNYDKLTRSI